MAFEETVGKVRSALGSKSGLEEKALFGGITFTINRNMVCSVNSRGLTLRTGLEGYDKALAMPGVKPYLLGKNTIKGMVIVEDPTKLSDADLTQWVGMAADVTSAMPPKPEKVK